MSDSKISESLRKQAKKYKVRTTYNTKSGKRKYRTASAIRNEIKKRSKGRSFKRSKFGAVARGSDGHYREQNPASGLKVNPNDNTKWIWLPVKWNCCQECGMYHSNRKIPESFWKREWDSPSSNIKAGVIVVRGDNLLMTQSYHDKFGFPKGAIDKGEKPHEAAVRELFEETGVVIDPVIISRKKPLNIVSGKNVYKMFVYNVPMNFKLASFPRDDAEITTFGWVNINQADKLKLSRAMRSVLETYKRSVKDNWRNTPSIRRVQSAPQPYKRNADSDQNWRRKFGKKKKSKNDKKKTIKDIAESIYNLQGEKYFSVKVGNVIYRDIDYNLKTLKFNLEVIAKKLKLKNYSSMNKKQLTEEISKKLKF